MSLLNATATATEIRIDAPHARRGRKPVALDPTARRKHIAIAIARLHFGTPVADLCERHDCSPRSVQLWSKLALGYADSEADLLRALVNSPLN